MSINKSVIFILIFVLFFNQKGLYKKENSQKAHMAHVSQKNLEFHITKIRTLSKVKVIQCNIILKVWPTGYLLLKFHNAIITNKKCQDIVKKKKIVTKMEDIF